MSTLATGIIGSMGLTRMLNGITELTLVIQALDASYAQLGSDQTASYATITSGTDINISPAVAITIPNGETVKHLRLYDTVNSDLIATVELVTDNYFPNGGDLIVSSYSIQASQG